MPPPPHVCCPSHLHLHSEKIDGVARTYCNMPIQHACFTRSSFPDTCAWCDENAQDEHLMESDHDASELAGKKCDPICKHRKLVRTKALPLWGSQSNGTGGRTIGRSGNGASLTRASNDDVTGASSWPSFAPAAVKETGSSLITQQARKKARTSTSAPRNGGLAAGVCSASNRRSICSFLLNTQARAQMKMTTTKLAGPSGIRPLSACHST